MTLAAYTGFRVGARNDDYRVPHLTLILYDLIILFSSNRTADEPPLELRMENGELRIMITLEVAC